MTDGTVVVKVGPSETNSFAVKLPDELAVVWVHPVPCNPQRREWKDRFVTRVVGQTLTVTRTDTATGWEQALELEATVDLGDVQVQLSTTLVVS